MARLKLPTVPSVLLVAVVLATAGPGNATKPEPRTTLTRFPPLVDCGPAPPVSPAPAGESDGFRANVLSLLHDIPSIAAAAPAGFVTARFGRADRGRAFARALCFGAASNRSSSGAAAGCRACLSAAARDATRGCGASRRAGVWRAGCFLGYADTDALSAREEAFRGWFYAYPADATTLEDRVCAGDRTGPDCDRCLEDAARATAALPWLVRMRGEKVIVVGYSCCLRVHLSVLPIARELSYTISPSMNPCKIDLVADVEKIKQSGIGAFSDEYACLAAMYDRKFGLYLLMMFAIGAQLGIVIGLLLDVIISLQDIPQPIQ